MNEPADIKTTVIRHLITDEDKTFLIDALANGDINYFKQTMSRRSPGTPDQKGSVFLDSWNPFQLVRFILDYNVEEFVPENPWCPIDGRPDLPCRYFKLVIPGRLGIIQLTDLPKGTKVEIRDDKNVVNTAGGSVQAHISGKLGEFVETTTLIVGPMETDLTKYEFFTVHPGLPIFGGKNVKREDLIGQSITASEAIDIGLTHALVERDIKVYKVDEMSGGDFRKVFAGDWFGRSMDGYVAVLFGSGGDVIHKYVDLDREKALHMLLLSHA
jgi:hypothetical protein